MPEPQPSEKGFDAEMADKIVECDGGGPIAGTKLAGRQEFVGRATGEYVDHGDPPWRWYLVVDLTLKPDGFPGDEVWCESGSLYPKTD